MQQTTNRVIDIEKNEMVKMVKYEMAQVHAVDISGLY